MAEGSMCEGGKCTRTLIGKRGNCTKTVKVFGRPSTKKQSEDTFLVVLTNAIEAIYGHFLIFLQHSCRKGPIILPLHRRKTVGSMTYTVGLCGEPPFQVSKCCLSGRLHRMKVCSWRYLLPSDPGAAHDSPTFVTYNPQCTSESWVF